MHGAAMPTTRLLIQGLRAHGGAGDVEDCTGIRHHGSKFRTGRRAGGRCGPATSTREPSISSTPGSSPARRAGHATACAPATGDLSAASRRSCSCRCSAPNSPRGCKPRSPSTRPPPPSPSPFGANGRGDVSLQDLLHAPEPLKCDWVRPSPRSAPCWTGAPGTVSLQPASTISCVSRRSNRCSPWRKREELEAD